MLINKYYQKKSSKLKDQRCRHNITRSLGDKIWAECFELIFDW